MDPEGEEDGAIQDSDSMRKGKCAVIKTSTRQTVFLPLVGLVPAEKLKPGDLVGVNKESYLILDKLPSEYDPRVKAMEVDERPTETYTDIGGLEKQIEELVEAIVLPMEQAEKFKTIGIKPPKGCLMYGAPGEPCSYFVVSSWTDFCRHGEDAVGTRMCCSDESVLSQTCWPFVSSNVYWRWRQARPRCL
jgi:hypothetical protein